jgi:hypothetical protein
MTEPVIKINIYDVLVITTEEYEKLEREVMAHLAVDQPTVGTRILTRILKEHNGRYREIMAQKNLKST